MIIAVATLLSSVANAQTIYDAAKFTGKDLNGTARFVGMGGAMGALGGDISTIGTNPAGIGIYRSNDIMTSFSFSAYGMESSYIGHEKRMFNSNLNNTHWSYDNIGFVLSTKIGNYTPVRFVNFGFNYHKSKSFYKNMGMDALLNVGPKNEIVSQTWQMAQQANGIRNSEFMEGREAFRDNEIGWLSILGWQGNLIAETGDKDSDGGNVYKSIINEIPYATFYSEERGGIDQYDFNVALNINDRAYLGFTIGAYDVDYSKYSRYDEDYENGKGAGYFLQSWNRISGSGFDFKIGAILRPFESSPFRIGMAVHTPTFYKLTLTTSAFLGSDLYYDGAEVTKPVDIDTQQAVGDMDRSYRLRTPWTYNLSLGYTVGSSLAVGAEYEYEDYSTMYFSYPKNGGMYPKGSGMSYENDQTSMLKGVHTVRVGAEYKVIPQFAFRLGYNYSSAAIEKLAYKDLPVNSINTDTDYANTKALNNYTLGIGYRGSLIYADLAYQYSTYKEDFYAFTDPDDFLNKTKVTNTRSQVLLTVGMRF